MMEPIERRRNLPWWPLLLLPTVLILPPGASRARSEEPQRTPGVQPPIPVSFAPVPRPPLAVLRPGAAVTIRIRQVFPRDGLSPAARLLNGLPAVQPGDHFLAEVTQPPASLPPLVRGTIVQVTRPGKFGRPGRLTLEISQLVEYPDGAAEPVPWLFDTEDRRFSTRAHRSLLTALQGLEGAGVGASVGSNLTGTSAGNPILVGGGAGVGLIMGLGYAVCRRGVEASLEQGDTFEVVVGTTSYRPVPKTLLYSVFPAPDPWRNKHKPKDQP